MCRRGCDKEYISEIMGNNYEMLWRVDVVIFDKMVRYYLVRDSVICALKVWVCGVPEVGDGTFSGAAILWLSRSHQGQTNPKLSVT